MAVITLGQILHTDNNEPLDVTNKGLHTYVSTGANIDLANLLTAFNSEDFAHQATLSGISDKFDTSGAVEVGALIELIHTKVNLNIDSSGVATVEEKGSDTFGHGAQDVTTGGSAVQLSAQACREVTLTAKDDNTGKIYIGGSTVSNASFGTYLNAGDSATLSVNNLNLIYIDADIDGEGVVYLYV